MVAIVACLVNFLLAYLVYIDGQKREINNLGGWVALSFFIPVIGCILYILKRPKQIVTNDIVKLPYGFRSKNLPTMIVAGMVYLIPLAVAVYVAIGPLLINSNQQGDFMVRNNSTKGTVASPSSLNPNRQADSTVVSDGHKLLVSYINVGQADSILVQIPDGKNVLIDAGNEANSSTVINYLKSHKVEKLDYAVFTHPDEEHIGGAASVIKSFDIGQVVMPLKEANVPAYQNLVTALNSKQITPIEATAGLTLDFGSETSAMLVAPQKLDYDDINSYSAVLRLVFGYTSFLFTGDASAQSEQDILTSGWNVKADVLKVSSHGADSATTPEFLAKVNPKYAVISVGKGNDYGNPAQNTLSALTKAGIQIFRTDQDGTIVVESDGETLSFNTISRKVKSTAPVQQPTQQLGTNEKNKVITIPKVSDIMVFIARSGDKYHRDGCKFLGKGKTAITLAEAKENGYLPCPVCNPPQ